MPRKLKSQSGERGRPARPSNAVPVSESNRAQVENVEYFLRALNQIAQALRDLGYSAEGEALAQVKADLHQRLFWTTEKPVSLLKGLH